MIPAYRTQLHIKICYPTHLFFPQLFTVVFNVFQNGKKFSVWKLPWLSMAITFRHTYSSMRSFILRNMSVTCVIFSIIWPTSCRSWSIEIGRPIIDVRHVWSVTRLLETCNTISSDDIWQSCFLKLCNVFILKLWDYNKMWTFLAVNEDNSPSLYSSYRDPDTMIIIKSAVDTLVLWQKKHSLKLLKNSSILFVIKLIFHNAANLTSFRKNLRYLILF